MKRWGFLMALLLIVLGACGLEAEDPSNATIDESVPPNVMIMTSNESYNMMQGGYKWTVEGRKKGEQKTTIADVASPPNQVLAGEKLTTIAKSETLALHFVVEPDHYKLYGWYEDGSKISIDDLEQLKGDEPVAIEVFADYPQGHASYVLPVQFE